MSTRDKILSYEIEAEVTLTVKITFQAPWDMSLVTVAEYAERFAHDELSAFKRSGETQVNSLRLIPKEVPGG